MSDYNQVINDYREAIRLVYGDKVADRSHFNYGNGWYYFELARIFEDGSVGVLPSINGPQAYRRKEIIERTSNLLNRRTEQLRREHQQPQCRKANNSTSRLCESKAWRRYTSKA